MLRYIMVLICTLCLGSCRSNEENKTEAPAEYVELAGSWQKTALKDVFLEETDSCYYAYRCKLNLPTGIRGGSLNAMIKTTGEGDDFFIVVNPNEYDKSEVSYGEYMRLWYKPDGGKAERLDLIYTPEGYRPMYNVHGSWSFYIAQREWAKHHTKVKFKGFTTDNPNAEKFVESPRGIGREGTDVYINPEFSIQY